MSKKYTADEKEILRRIEILNFPDNKYYAEGISEPVTLKFDHLSWWRKDRLGYPIETFKNKPIKNFLRIICQNIRKITG